VSEDNNKGREQRMQMVEAVKESPAALPLELETVFNEHHRLVFKAAHRITGNAEDAEDVLQTVFTRLLRGGPWPGLAENPGGYLRRSAVNAALDVLRRRKRARVISLESGKVEPEEQRPTDPQKQLEGHELRRRLRRALAGLNQRAAEIFSLRFFEGYGNREIAQMLGTTSGTVAVTLNRARTQLKSELSEYAGGTIS
jgi:RNA polymerase sigma-70 factor (ECF subfamily)